MQCRSHAYESCVHFLREKTRDRDRFGVLFDENVSYGFRRNLWAMKGFGVVCSLICVTGVALRTLLDWKAGGVEPVAIGALILSGALLLLWIILINPTWIRVTADAYAERLLAASDEL